MSIKNQSSQSDSIIHQIIKAGQPIHHAFCIESSSSPKEYARAISEIVGQNFLKPIVFEEGVCTIDIARAATSLVNKKYSETSQLIIFIGAHTFTIEAQNALLKTLEEPTNFVYIFLVTSSKENLLPTVLSRVSQIKDNAVSEETILEAQKFIKKQLKDKYIYCQDIFDRHEKGEISRLFIANFVDIVSKEVSANILNQKDKKNFIENTQKIYNLLSLPSCSVKQALEALATIVG